MSDVRIRVVADASQAEKSLGEVADSIDDINRAKAKGIQQASEAVVGGGGGSGPASPEDMARRMADEFSRRAGIAIAKFVGGFLLDQGMATFFSLNRKVGKDNSRLDMAESAIRGSIQWGTAGAAVAGPAGAVVGALLGGVNSLLNSQKEIQDKIDLRRMNYSTERYEARATSRRSQEDQVFDYTLGMMSVQEQAAALRERKVELTGYGVTGENYYDRLFKLQNRLMMEKSGNSTREDIDALDKVTGRLREFERQAEEITDAIGSNRELPKTSLGSFQSGTAHYWEALESYSIRKFGLDDERTRKIQTQLSQVNSQIDPLDNRRVGIYLQQLDQLRSLAAPSSITDSFSSKGLGVGAQIDRTSVNRDILETLKGILRETQKANSAPVEVLPDALMKLTRSVFG